MWSLRMAKSGHKIFQKQFQFGTKIKTTYLRKCITKQWRLKQLNVGCAIHKIGPKYWVRKIYNLLTDDPSIGCASAQHPAHPAPPPLPNTWILDLSVKLWTFALWVVNGTGRYQLVVKRCAWTSTTVVTPISIVRDALA